MQFPAFMKLERELKFCAKAVAFLPVQAASWNRGQKKKTATVRGMRKGIGP
jgi:hypothetical protein